MSVSLSVLVKTGAKAVLKATSHAAILKPEETGSKVIVAMVAVCAPIILIVVLLCGITSAVSGYVTSGSGMSDFWESDLYIAIEKANTKWESEKVNEIVNLAFADNLEYSAEVEELSWQEKVTFLEEQNIFLQVEAPTVPYLLAYINHCDSIQSKWGNVFSLVVEEDEETISWIQVRSFYDDITKVEPVSYMDGDIKKTTYYIQVLSPEEIAQLYWQQDQVTAQMYIDSFEQYCSFLGAVSAISFGSIVMHDTGFKVPHYFQADYQNVSYGRGTIASSGCAPTCIAMCVSYLNSTTVTPVDVVAWTGNRYYNFGDVGGSYWSIFPASASHWNCTILETKDPNTVLQALESGYPVVVSMAPGHFTQNGHFIVLCGSSADTFYVNDPNKSNYKKYGNQVPAEWVWKEAKGFFIFYKGAGNGL